MANAQSNFTAMDAPFQFSIVRYLEDVLRNEPRNVGLIVRSVTDGAVRVRFTTPSAHALRSLAPDARALVATLERELERAAADGEPFGRLGAPSEEGFLDRARYEFTGHLQLTEPRGLLAPSIEDAVESLFHTYIAQPRVLRAAAVEHVPTAPSHMRRQLWSAFKRSHLIDSGLVEKSFTVKGEHAKWTFDIGYENGALSLIQSIALDSRDAGTNLSRALVLKGMVEEVKKESRKKEVHSTAVASLPADTGILPSARDARDILRDAEIDVCPIQQLPRLITKIREEVKL